MFATVFGSKKEMAKLLHKGCYFFDRDPKQFHYILNYLRTAKVIIPESKGDLHELLLEAEYYSIDDMKDAVQRAIGGLLFEETFKNFSITYGAWKESPLNTSTILKDDKIATRYMGLPQILQPIDIESRTALRMTSLLMPMERRALCTTEIFNTMTSRVEVKIFPMPESSQTTEFGDNMNQGVIFEFYLWNLSTDEYVGIFLKTSSGAKEKNMNIVCHVAGTHKEKIVENVWEFEQEITVLIQALTDKSEVRVNGTRKKTFHVPVALDRIAPFHIVMGQRADEEGVQRLCDVAVSRVAVFG